MEPWISVLNKEIPVKAHAHRADDILTAIRIAKEFGISTDEREYTLDELYQADEVLITSASALCMRVFEVNGSPVGGKAADTIKQFQDALLKDYLEKTE